MTEQEETVGDGTDYEHDDYVYADSPGFRVQLLDSETDEPLLEADGSPVILDEWTSQQLLHEAKKDGVSLGDKLAEILDAAGEADEEYDEYHEYDDIDFSDDDIDDDYDNF